MAHDEFNSFKMLITNDEERKTAVTDIGKTIQKLERKITDISSTG